MTVRFADDQMRRVLPDREQIAYARRDGRKKSREIFRRSKIAQELTAYTRRQLVELIENYRRAQTRGVGRDQIVLAR